MFARVVQNQIRGALRNGAVARRGCGVLVRSSGAAARIRRSNVTAQPTPLAVPRRALSTPDQHALGDSLPDLSIDDMLDIHELTMRACQTRMSIFAQQLEAIKEKSDVAIVTRWQTVLSTWMSALLHCLVMYGFPQNMTAVTVFIQMYDEKTKVDPRGQELADAAKERFEVLFKEGLGMEADGTLSLEDARQIVMEQCSKIQTSDFLAKLDVAMAEIDSTAGNTEIQELTQRKQTKVMELMQPVQMEVYSAYGKKQGTTTFDGEEGFMRMQAALLKHHGDEAMMYHMGMATNFVFSRAGLLPAE